jgi:signal transduction histidine kinase
VAVIDPATVVLLVVTVGTAAIGVVAWRNRPQPGMTTLSVLMGWMSVWTGAVVVASSVSGYWPSRIAVNVVLIATAVTAVTLFAFALEYAGYERYLQWPYPLLLAVEPALVAVLTFTNEFHNFFWADVYRDAAHYSGYTYEAALGQYLHIWFAYLLTTAAVVILIRKLLLSRAIHRTQTAAVLIAALAPVVGNVLYVTEVFPLGQIVGFAVTGVALYVAITHGKLVDLTPVARATVLEELEMGVIVVDDSGQIVDSNPYARELLAFDDANAIIGEKLSDLIGEHATVLDPDASHARVDETITMQPDDEELDLHVKVSPLTDGLDRAVGQLLLFEDVTERERRRAEIERRNEQLQEFASMVSHDVRNPLDVASGYVELMRQDRREADDGVSLDVDKLDETADALGRIESIVDDVLTLAREGNAATEPERVSLRSVARAAWDHVVTQDARLVVGTDAHLTADRGQLERLLENLFRNAVEHGGTDVTVSIGLLEDDRQGFYVADDGDGIPESVRDTLFESGVTSDERGTGFGLAIVRELTDAHDWVIDMTGSDDGGARFEIANVEFAAGVAQASTDS